MKPGRFGTWMVLMVAVAAAADAQTVGADYQRLCSGCHGANFRLPSGAATTRDADALATIIRDGIALKGMPAFGGHLSAARQQPRLAQDLGFPFGKTGPDPRRGRGS